MTREVRSHSKRELENYGHEQWILAPSFESVGCLGVEDVT